MLDQDTERKIKLYSIAKYVNREVFLKAQLDIAGANQARLLEKYEKNKKALRSQTIAMKVIYSIIFAMLSIMPLMTYFTILDYLKTSDVPMETLVFIGSLLFGMFFGMQLVYLLILGMISTSALMSGEAFKFIETLPISREKLRKLTFLTIFRSLDAPIITMIAIFPIIMFLATQNVLVFFICIVISFLNVLFTFSILVFVGERVNRVMMAQDVNSKKATAIRLITMFGYIIMALGTGFLIQWAFTSVPMLFTIFSSSKDTPILNFILSIIPYPFAPSYLIILIISPIPVPIELWITTIIGCSFFILLTWKLYTTTLQSLRSITTTDVKRQSSLISTEGTDNIKIEVISISPVKAFIRKDLLTASRDLQTLMFLVMPIILPIITLLSTFASTGGTFSTLNEELIFFWVLVIFYSPMISLMLVSGLLNMEESGASTLASLPIIPRDQTNAKLFLMLIIQTLSYLVPTFLYLMHPDSLFFILTILATLPMAWIFLFITFEMKISFFGKMKYKYVVEEINTERKVLKWTLMILADYGVCIGMFVFFIMLLELGFLLMLIIILIINIAILIGLVFRYQKMFPKIHIIKP